MEGASNGPEGIVPDQVKFVLNWNPPVLARPTLPKEPPIGYTRRAAFYDKHIAPHLILKHVVFLGTLVSAMETAVDQAIQGASNNLNSLDTNELPTPSVIIKDVSREDWFPDHELGIASLYLQYTAKYCGQIASTLAIHPSSGWDTVIRWKIDPKESRWAIADGVLVISRNVNTNGHPIQELLQSQDIQTRKVLSRLASDSTPLAVWEFKYLTLGTTEVMREIENMGKDHQDFKWKKCPPETPDCSHNWRAMEESKEDYDKGFDPLSPPWILPINHLVPASAVTNLPTTPVTSLPIASTSAAAAPSTPLRDGLRDATRSPLYKEASSSSSENGEEVSRKRHHNNSDSSEYKGPPKRRKAGDGSYKPPGKRREVNAQSFLQQTWAEAVRSNCTVVVLNSGNHEIIGIRHRETQTLYISPVIEPHSCSNPAYGKIQVGIYITAIKERMDRERQNVERETTQNDPPIPPTDEYSSLSELPSSDLDDNSRERRQSGSNRRTRGGSKGLGKQKGRTGGNIKRHASGKESEALLAHAAKQTRLYLRLNYNIYDSPHPASFRRLPDKCEIAPDPAKAAQTPALPPGGETMLTSMSESCIHITACSEMHPGSTGIVHIGTMAVDMPGPKVEVAIKIAFSRDEKKTLAHEHQIYLHLHSRHVQGIPSILGLFADGADKEGPHVLLMSYAGISLSSMRDASNSAKKSLLKTITSIHMADVLHGDIRFSNFCVTPRETFVVDFSHATIGSSKEDKERELSDLSHLLGIKLPHSHTEPASKKPVLRPLRRSARIKDSDKDLAQKPTSRRR